MKTVPEFDLVPKAVSEAAIRSTGFSHASEETGRRHKLGGDPTYLQEAYVKKCEVCQNDMSFYGQLDSIDDDHTLADVGLIHVWVCFDCFETTAVLQSG